MTSATYPHAPSPGKTETSAAAAPSIHAANAIMEQVFNSFVQDGPQTADEIAKRLNRKPTSVRPRVSQLKAQGRIVFTGECRKNEDGHEMEVYRVAPAMESGVAA